ncbi:MAG: hypothetical protein ACYC6T_08275 [Thermoleophilia bacterium]
MEGLVGWLDAHGAAVQAAATVVLVAVTVHYAWTTSRLWRDQRRSQLARFTPLVVATSLTWLPNRGIPHEPTVRTTLRNVGLGPAFDLIVEFIPATCEEGPRFRCLRSDKPDLYLEGSSQEEVFFPIRAETSGEKTRPDDVVNALIAGEDVRLWIRYRDALARQRKTHVVFKKDEFGAYFVADGPTEITYPPTWKLKLHALFHWKRGRLT